MSKLTLAARILLGLIFVVFGLNGLFNFLPMPPPAEEGAMALIGAMMGTGYLWQLLKIVEIVSGAMLLSGKYVPLSIVMLTPVVIPIIGFHLFVAPSGLLLGGAVFVFWLILLIAYWRHFACLLNANASLDAASSD